MEEELGIQHKYGTVYHPQRQGAVERAHRTLKKTMAQIMSAGKANWVDALPIALLKMRNQERQGLFFTPHEIRTGRPMNWPVVRSTLPNVVELPKEMSEYVKAISHAAKTVCLQVHEAKGETSCKPPTEELKPLTEELGLEPGSWVFVKEHKVKWKEPKWCGPYEVLSGLSHSVKIKKRKQNPVGTLNPLRQSQGATNQTQHI